MRSFRPLVILLTLFIVGCRIRQAGEVKPMLFETLVVGPLGVNCFILADPDSRVGIVVDPGGDADRVISRVRELGLSVRYVVNTHGHFDHVGGNRRLIAATGARLLIHEKDVPFLSHVSRTAAMYGADGEDSPLPDDYLRDGMEITFGSCRLTVLETPGHTPGGCCLWDREGKRVITGDTLFADGVGRTDFPGSSYEALVKGIREKLFTLPDETVAYPGHGPSTTIGHEKKHNPYLH
ncbi:MAG: MBL fold metallo-hydrolase [Desulfuromonadia bacterium]